MRNILLITTLMILLSSCDFFTIQDSELKCSTDKDCKTTEFCNDNRDCEFKIEYETGTEGGNCYANSTCNENLVCNTESICELDLCLNNNCKEWETCNASSGNCDLNSGRCATNGDCIGTEICGPDSHICYNPANPCENIDCGANGDCINDNSSPKCDCQTGYNDNNTNLTCTKSCVASDCSSNGNCDDNKEEKFCTCDTGYHVEGMTCIKDGEECTEGSLCNGLVAHYEFEDNANDSSGNGNDGMEHGGVAYVDGVIGKAGSFDGIDDYIKLITDEFKIEQFSINFWAKTPSNQRSPIIHYINNIGHYGWSVFIKYDPWGDIYFGSRTEAGGNQNGYLAFNNEEIYNNTWQQVVITSENNILKLYLNNNLQGSISISFVWTTVMQMYIGASRPDTTQGENYFYNGLLDDLRIYNRALTESEITELYEMGNIE